MANEKSNHFTSTNMISLPNEILHGIVHRTSTDDLCNLCLVSKRICAIAQSTLYQTYHQSPRAPIRRFLRTLVCNSSLACLVRNIRVNAIHVRESRIGTRWSSERDTEIRELRQRLFKPRFRTFYWAGNADLILLLSLTVNITTLFIGAIGMSDQSHLRDLLKDIERQGSDQQFLKHLETLKLKFLGHSARLIFSDLRNLIGLPSLQKVELDRITSNRGHDSCFPLDSLRIMAPHVDLRRSNLSHVDASDLLKACVNLVSFHMEDHTGESEWAVTGYTDQVLHAIWRHRHSLESLILNIRWLPLPQHQHPVNWNLMSKLRHLEIQSETFIRVGGSPLHKLLPLSLERLILTDCGPKHAPAIVEFMQHYSSRLPRFRRLIISEMRIEDRPSDVKTVMLQSGFIFDDETVIKFEYGLGYSNGLQKQSTVR